MFQNPLPTSNPIPSSHNPIDDDQQYTNAFDQQPMFIQRPEHPTMLLQAYQNPIQDTSVPSTATTMFDDGSTMQSETPAASSFSSGQSPTLIDLLLPGTDMNAPPPDYYRPQQSSIPYQPSGSTPPPNLMEEDDDVEEIIRQADPGPEAWVMRLPSPTPSSSSSSSDGSVNTMYQQPLLKPGSPEMLMLRFDRQTCGILSVKDGPTENPWRTLVWPLARDSPALYHAISSMTAFHTSKEKPEMRVDGVDHMRRSIKALAAGIANMRVDAALATTLVLAFSESWDQHISTGIQHLRGAKALVNKAVIKHQQNSMSGDELTRFRFLCNTWIYMDVLARLTSLQEDDFSDFDSVLSPLSGPFESVNEVDPLMGCAGTLFPLIGRVANLVQKVRKTESNSFAIISQAIELKTLVEQWEPPAYFEPPEDPTSEVQHSFQTAESYRWATLLYLHQAVPEIPSEPAAKLAKKVLVLLATVPISSRATIVQIYPLFAASCEAVEQEARQWVHERWTAMQQRLMIGNIDRCMEVIKEVWDRRDAFEHEKAMRLHRRTGSRIASFIPPMDNMKRKAVSADDADATGFFGMGEPGPSFKRRATVGDMGMPAPARVNQPNPRKRSTDSLENIEPEYMVRGKLHWVGVMNDWNWEGMFSYHGFQSRHAVLITLTAVLLG